MMRRKSGGGDLRDSIEMSTSGTTAAACARTDATSCVSPRPTRASATGREPRDTRMCSIIRSTAAGRTASAATHPTTSGSASATTTDADAPPWRRTSMSKSRQALAAPVSSRPLAASSPLLRSCSFTACVTERASSPKSSSLMVSLSSPAPPAPPAPTTSPFKPPRMRATRRMTSLGGALASASACGTSDAIAASVGAGRGLSTPATPNRLAAR
mmetsp:Transcript_10528/g.36736  ORF Transcript_10528/g.36736 Transcript_10528/m.36736 type:complete len:214 (+) Transcript_10528:5154-5795(+)